MDVTILKLSSGVPVYLHVLIDIFSRKILKCIVAREKSAAITCENVKSSFAEYPEILTAGTDLVVDGGSENKGEVDLLLAESDFLNKFVAQKVVAFSNSMVEATNKVLKNNYLQDRKISNVGELQKFLDEVVLDFNTRRPNAQLAGLTPTRVFAGKKPDPDRFKASILDAS